MQEQQIYDQLTPLFRDLFDDETLELRPDLAAADVPEWDSFNHINLIVAVEARFGIKFQTAELESMQNVGHLVAIIQRKLHTSGR
jgi:acyl carrier protein